MPHIRFGDVQHEARSGESVLEALERDGVQIPNACRSGVCQSCLMRAVTGEVPRAAQAGLKDTLRAQGYFLACRCRPENDLEVVLAGEDVAGEIPVRLADVDMLSPSVMRVRLELEQPFEYRNGQFINLIREDGVRRSYSLAGGSQTPRTVELHVRHFPDGAMSGWLMQQAGTHPPMRIQGPLGNCFYTDGDPEQPMLLIGAGTGLAPLYGILCDALEAGHTGPIHLYHGARTPDGLYLTDRLRALAAEHANLHYTPCVLEPETAAQAAESFAVGAVDEIGFGKHPELKGWRSYFCGDPNLVNRMRKRAYLSGAALADIHADAFLPAATPT